jgi:mono/diheme cytochrome c family protein
MTDGPSLLLGASVLHLLAAGAWLGGLLPLLLVVRAAPARTGAMAARWFSPLGKVCVLLLVGSAVVQFWQLIGGMPGVVGTAYGWTATLKLVLFAVLLGFAWVNRYRLAPRLLGPAPDVTRPVLLRSIAVQTGFGVLVVLAASVLSSLPPSMHEQPVWPFPLRPSLVALSDPDLRAEVMRGGEELLAGVALLLLGLALWRRRWAALAGIAAGLLVGGASASHLDLLLVEAYPTSYYHSPTGFAATSISHGAELFPQHCASCHGENGKGHGPAAAGLPVPPADLTAEHLWAHDDGELFWWLSHGIDAPEGGLAMPGFAGQLLEDDRWALIDYIRGHNAGVSLHETGRWAVPIQAPEFSMTCPGDREAATNDFRGSVLHVVAMPPGGGPVPPSLQGSPVSVITVLLTQGSLPDHPTACVTADPAVWNAYATVAGLPAAALAGAQFLVDPNGWMRAAQRPGERTMRWADPALLLADVRAIYGHPIAAAVGGHLHH